MQSDYYINLHFNQAVSQRTGYAFKIGDKGCTFHLHCEDLDPTGMLPHIVFNHPNNTCVEGVPTGSGRDYTYTIQGNEFGVCGKTVVDLKFYDSLDATQRISTASFMIEIIPDTYTDFEESSSSYADSLERAREEIDAAILDLQGAEHDLEEAEGDLDNMSGQFADTLQDYIDAFGNTAPINPCGEYDPAEPYVPRDAVEYTAGGKTLTYINRSACTGIAPTDPDYGAAHWQIMIDVSVGGSFSALSDVNVDPQTLADGQMPVYNATGQVWENKTILENSLTSTATDKALTAAQGKELQDNKQPKELETAITIAGTQETTVEGALDGINDYVDDSVEALTNVYGAKNFLSYPYEETTKTENGVTFTDNGDGSISVVASSGATADTYFGLHYPYETLYVKKGTYILSGCPTGGSEATYYLSSSYANDTGEGITVTEYSGDYRAFLIVIKSGTVISTPITFKPMFRDARILDPTFAPFAETNLQLTQNKAERKDLTAIFATGSTNTMGAQIAKGKFFYLNGVYCKALTDIAVNATFTRNTNYKVDTLGNELEALAFNTPQRKGLDANSSVSYTVPNGVYLVTSWQAGASNEFSGLWIAFVTPYAEGCSVFTLVTPSYINVSVSANTITFTHTGSIYFVQTNITCITEII